jgi:hypothetical protein
MFWYKGSRVDYFSIQSKHYSCNEEKVLKLIWIAMNSLQYNELNSKLRLILMNSRTIKELSFVILAFNQLIQWYSNQYIAKISTKNI